MHLACCPWLRAGLRILPAARDRLAPWLFALWLTVPAGLAMADPAGLVAFDIPAQPLAAAIERYSVVSGRQVVYDGRLAAGRRSAAVEGLLTPEAALRRLLDGTGLGPRDVAADAFLLVALPPAAAASRPDPLANTAPPALVEQYYGLIQARLRTALCADSLIRGGGYRLALGFWIGAAGAVSRTALLGTTGSADLDRAIDRAVGGLAVGAPPPAGFAQPVVLVVTPALTRDCRTLAAAQPAEAAAP
jgi:hypothetical protein